MKNTAQTIGMISSFLILMAYATSGSLEGLSPDPACPNGTLLCNGTCVDMLADSQNCGSCGNICSLGMICINGSCTCMAGLVVCNKTCTDTSIDPRNCGVCGNVCSANAICNYGICSNMSPEICIDGDCSYPIVVQHRRI